MIRRRILLPNESGGNVLVSPYHINNYPSDGSWSKPWGGSSFEQKTVRPDTLLMRNVVSQVGPGRAYSLYNKAGARPAAAEMTFALIGSGVNQMYNTATYAIYNGSSFPKTYNYSIDVYNDMIVCWYKNVPTNASPYIELVNGHDFGELTTVKLYRFDRWVTPEEIRNAPRIICDV